MKSAGDVAEFMMMMMMLLNGNEDRDQTNEFYKNRDAIFFATRIILPISYVDMIYCKITKITTVCNNDIIIIGRFFPTSGGF